MSGGGMFWTEEMEGFVVIFGIAIVVLAGVAIYFDLPSALIPEVIPKDFQVFSDKFCELEVGVETYLTIHPNATHVKTVYVRNNLDTSIRIRVFLSAEERFNVANEIYPDEIVSINSKHVQWITIRVWSKEVRASPYDVTILLEKVQA